MPRAYITPVTKRLILEDIDRGVSRKLLLERYGLKNYSNIYRIIQQREKLIALERTMESAENEKGGEHQLTEVNIHHNDRLLIALEQLKLLNGVMEKIFASLRERLPLMNSQLKEMLNTVEESKDESEEDEDDETKNDQSDSETDDDDDENTNNEQEKEDGEEHDGYVEEEEEEGEQYGVVSEDVKQSYLQYMQELKIFNNAMDTLEGSITAVNKEAGKIGKMIVGQSYHSTNSDEDDNDVEMR
jgi:hypothetical protein